ERDLSLPERQRIAEQEAQALSHCAGVLVPSARTRSDVAALGIAETMIGVVEPGLETPSSAPRGRHSGNGGPLHLLCVGTIIERKGHVDLIEGLSLLRDRPWQLGCVGSRDRDRPAPAPPADPACVPPPRPRPARARQPPGSTRRHGPRGASPASWGGVAGDA